MGIYTDMFLIYGQKDQLRDPYSNKYDDQTQPQYELQNQYYFNGIYTMSNVLLYIEPKHYDSIVNVIKNDKNNSSEGSERSKWYIWTSGFSTLDAEGIKGYNNLKEVVVEDDILERIPMITNNTSNKSKIIELTKKFNESLRTLRLEESAYLNYLNFGSLDLEYDSKIDILNKQLEILKELNELKKLNDSIKKDNDNDKTNDNTKEL
jgi:hypothetical protein